MTRAAVAAPPEEVWPWVAHPGGMARWNEKLVDDDAPPLGDLREGSRYRVTYRMSGPPVRMWAEITAWDPPRTVEVRYRSAEPAGSDVGLGRNGWAMERLEIQAERHGCSLTRTVRVHDLRIAWPLRLLAGLLMRFGTPRDGTHLDALKRLVEEGAAA